MALAHPSPLRCTTVHTPAYTTWEDLTVCMRPAVRGGESRSPRRKNAEGTWPPTLRSTVISAPPHPPTSISLPSRGADHSSWGSGQAINMGRRSLSGTDRASALLLQGGRNGLPPPQSLSCQSPRPQAALHSLLPGQKRRKLGSQVSRASWGLRRQRQHAWVPSHSQQGDTGVLTVLPNQMLDLLVGVMAAQAEGAVPSGSRGSAGLFSLGPGAGATFATTGC